MAGNEKDVPYVTSQCNTCRHYGGNGSCDAFDRIPADIASNARDHTRPYEGDQGIRWEAKDDAG